jgi:hypothetical protein
MTALQCRLTRLVRMALPKPVDWQRVSRCSTVTPLVFGAAKVRDMQQLVSLNGCHGRLRPDEVRGGTVVCAVNF